MPARREVTAVTVGVGHVVSLFPVASETFVADSMLACRAHGQAVHIWSLRPPRSEVIHPRTHDLYENLDYPVHPLLPGFWIAILGALLFRPGVVISCMASITLHSGGFTAWSRNLYALLRGCQVVREARGRGISAFYAHFANAPAVTAWVAARLLRVPFGIHAHGFDMEVHPRLLGKMAREAALCVTVSEAGREYLRERAGEETARRFRLLRCGVSIPSTNGVHDRAAVLRIVCVGRLRRGKGWHVLLEALAGLKQRNVAFHCRAVGEGPLRDELWAAAQRLGIDQHIDWLGPLPRPRVEEELCGADLFALPLVPVPGEREGLPVVVLEAMAHGLPVVASPLYGIPEVIVDGETGLFAPPGDAKALAAAMERLARDPELTARLGRAARERIQQDFDAASTGRELAGWIDEMAASK